MAGFWDERVRICGKDGEDEGLCEADEAPDGEKKDEGVSEEDRIWG